MRKWNCVFFEMQIQLRHSDNECLKYLQAAYKSQTQRKSLYTLRTAPSGEVPLLTFCSLSNGFYLKSISWSLLKAKKSKCSWLNDYKRWKSWCVLPISICFNLGRFKHTFLPAFWQLLWRGMEYKSPKLKNFITDKVIYLRKPGTGTGSLQLVLQLGVEIWSCHCIHRLRQPPIDQKSFYDIFLHSG